MFELWPFTNFHDLNLDWIISVWKKVEKYLENITEYMTRAENAADESEHAAAIAEAAKNEILSRHHTTPQAYGAVGDGVTDDTAAIQEMFDDTDAPVYFPPGKYLVTSGVNDNETDRPIFMEGSLVYNGGGAALTTNNKYNVFIVIDVESAVSDFTNGSIGARLVNCNNCTIIIKKAKGFEDGVVYEGNNGGFAYNKTWTMLLLNNMNGLHGKAVGTGWVNENQYFGGRYTVDTSKTWRNLATGIHLEGTNSHIANANTFNEPSFENIGCGIKLNHAFYNNWNRTRFENVTQPVNTQNSSVNKITCSYGDIENDLYDDSINVIYPKIQANIDEGLVNIVSTGSLIGKVASNSSYTVATGVVGLNSGVMVDYVYGGKLGNSGALGLPSGRMCGMLCEIDPSGLYMVSIKNSTSVRYMVRMYDVNDVLIDQPPIAFAYGGGVTSFTKLTSGDNVGGYSTGANLGSTGLYMRFPEETKKVLFVACANGEETEVTEIIVRSTSSALKNITPNEMRIRGGAPTSAGRPGQIVVENTGTCYIYDGAAWKTITTS